MGRGIKFFVSALMLVGASTSALGAELYNETLENGTEVIFLNGTISSGDEERFRELSVKYQNAIVVLNSSGGMLKPALEIGRQIRLRGYRTLVMEDDECASACALIWLAGTQRILSGDGKIGFHASYVDEGGRKVESGVANAMVGFYLSQLNLSESAVVFTTLAPPDKVEWIRAESSGSVPIEFTVWKDSAKPAVVSIPPPIQTRPATRSNPISSSAQSSYQWLVSMRNSPDYAVNGAKSIGAQGPLVSILADHLTQILANDLVLLRISQEFQAAAIDPVKDPDSARVIIFNFSTSSQLKGLRRLAQNDIDKLFSIYALAFEKNLTNCSALADVKSEASVDEFAIIQKLGNDNLRDYLRILRSALIAEVEDYPKPIQLTEKQIAIAENAFAKDILSALGNDEAALERFYTISANYENYSPVEYCPSMYIMFNTVSQMNGLSGSWMRRQFAGYMSEGM